MQPWAGRGQRPKSPRTSSPPPRASGASKLRSSGGPAPPAAPVDCLPDEGQPERQRAALLRSAQAVTPQQVRELRGLQRWPGAVGSVLEAVALLLGTPEVRLQSARQVLQRSLPERLRRFRLDDVTLGQSRRLQALLQQPGFDEEAIGCACPSALPLAAWCQAVGALLAETSSPPHAGEPQEGAARGPPAELQEPPQPQPEPPAELLEPPADALGPAVAGGADLVVTPDLEALGAEERRQVNDLRVERPGIGSVLFHGITDCTGLDVAGLVRLTEGEVLVYPEPRTKPQPGRGLNKCATVTMHRCWPPQGRARLQDERARERYREKIRAMTEDRGARFLDYDCTSGVWMFQVEHF